MAFFDIFKSKKKKFQESKYNVGMKKTRESALGELNNVFKAYSKPCEELFEDIEEIFIMADIGVDTVVRFVDELREDERIKKMTDMSEFKELLIDRMFDLYLKDEIVHTDLKYNEGELNVYLFVGVNGVGKTTSIAKIAHKLKAEGKKVLLAAGDTFRAGAVDQLKIWGERIGCEVVTKPEGSDPASVIYEGVQVAKAKGYDVLLCDTAGRLQNKVNLMKELEKMRNIIARECSSAPQEVLLVVDATTGQNGLSQAKVFNEATQLTGVILTKLDGTAKGGIVLAIRDQLGMPIKYVGLGEKIDDLEPFDIEGYIYGLFKDIFEG